MHNKLTKKERQIIVKKVKGSGFRGIKALDYAQLLTHDLIKSKKNMKDKKTFT